MGLAHAASGLGPAEASQQLTLSSLLLLILVVITMTGLVVWSWRHRRSLELRRKQVESALRTVASQQLHLSDCLHLAMFSFEPGRGFVTLSEGVSRLLPVSAQQLLDAPQTLLQHIADDDTRTLSWIAERAECPTNFAWLGRTRNTDANGGQRWIQMRTTTDIGPLGERRVVGMLLDVSDLKRAHQALEASREELRRLAAHREEERENEYRRMAREFHDELGQVLTVARLRLQLLPRETGSATDKAIADVDGMIVEAYRSVKSIATELRPPALNLGLAAAIEWQAERTLRPAGARFTAAIRYDTAALPETVSTTLFRIVQESFTNIVRYAGAGSVHVSLRESNGTLLLEIADDGSGFAPDKVDGHTHFGLTGMRERVIALGGALEIDSAPGEGTRIHVHVPQAPMEVKP